MGGRRRCCCECYTATDNFDRGDGTDIGPLWEECSGDWFLYWEKLTCDEAEAIAAFRPMVGWPVGIFRATVVLVDLASGASSYGAVARIIAYNGSDDGLCADPGAEPGDVWKLELHVMNALGGELRLYKGTELIGTRTCLWPGEVTTSITLCIGETEIKGSCTNEVGTYIWACHDDMSDKYFAVGCGNTNAVYYESVWYSDHEDHDPSCPGCDLPCCCPCVEATDERPPLAVTVVAGTDPECYIDGETATLLCSGEAGACCVWTTDDASPLVLICYNDEEHELELEMQCYGDGPEDYKMTATWPNNDGGNAACCDTTDWPLFKQQRGIYGVAVCEPLQMQFGPFKLWRDPSMLTPDCCWCCEEFYLLVTL